MPVANHQIPAAAARPALQYACSVPHSLDPQPLSFDVRLADLEGPVVIEYDGSAGVALLDLEQRLGGYARLVLTRSDKPDPRVVQGMLVTRTVGEVATQLSEAKPLRVFSVPRGTVETSFNALPMAGRALGSLGLLFLYGMAFVLIPDAGWRWFLAAAVVAAIAALLARRPRVGTGVTHHYRVGEERHALRTLLEQRPAALRAASDVDRIKEEYGALLSDLLYRIENPALFDVAAGPTRAFTAALLQWDNAGPAMTGAERSTLAARVRVTFDAAKANAEALGLAHIPEESRDAAQRALKSLRLAAAATTEAERRAARTQAVRILGSLALYYLPDAREAELALEGRRLLALPGRRTPRDA